MNIQLKKILPGEIPLFRKKMIESFTQGVLDRFGDIAAAPIPPENEADEALKQNDCDVFIITAAGKAAGGAIIRRLPDHRCSLDLFFIFKEFLNCKIGTAAWQMIEAHYPETEVWETHTPYFERRNIHFYLNKCHFRIVEFFNEFHREEHDLTEEFRNINDSGFFRFEKRVK